MTPLAYRPRAATALLGISRSTLWRWIADGRLSTRKIGGVTLLSGEEVRALAASMPELAAQKQQEIMSQRRARSTAKWAEQAAMPRHGVPGTVYVIGCGRHHVKIGFTRSSAAERLKDLQTGAPEPLFVIHEVRACSLAEEMLHERFRAYRSAGEWFRRKGELDEWITQGCPLEPFPNATPTFTPTPLARSGATG